MADLRGSVVIQALTGTRISRTNTVFRIHLRLWQRRQRLW